MNKILSLIVVLGTSMIVNADLMQLTVTGKVTSTDPGSGVVLNQDVKYKFLYDMDKAGFNLNNSGTPVIYDDTPVFDRFFVDFAGDFLVTQQPLAVDALVEYHLGTEVSNNSVNIRAGFGNHWISLSGTGSIESWAVDKQFNAVEYFVPQNTNAYYYKISSMLKISDISPVSTAQVPEPSVLILISCGLAVFGAAAFRRVNRS